MIPTEHIIYFSSALFGIGLVGLFLQKNLLRVFLAIEAMLNGAAFGFIGIALHYHNIEGHIMFLMILAVAAAEVGIGLLVLLLYDKFFHNLDITLLTRQRE